MGAVYLLCLLICSRLVRPSTGTARGLLTSQDDELLSDDEPLRQAALRAYLLRLESFQGRTFGPTGPPANDNDSGHSDKLFAIADRGRYPTDAKTRLELLRSAYPLVLPVAEEAASLGLTACTSPACDNPLSETSMFLRRMAAIVGSSMDADPPADRGDRGSDATLNKERGLPFTEGEEGMDAARDGYIGAGNMPEVVATNTLHDSYLNVNPPSTYSNDKRASLKNNFGRPQTKPYSASTAMYRYRPKTPSSHNGASTSKSRLNTAPNVNDRLLPSYSNQRFIFGSDDRGRVVGATTRKYPYSNVVRMSNGCTGTLVSPYHVLTAAHCLHTGDKFKFHPTSIKVYVPHSMGPKVYYGKTAKVSRKWHKISKMSNLHRAMFDYGILQLRRPVTGRRHYTPFDWRSASWRRPIKFIAYPHDVPYMLESTCVVDYKAGSLLLNRCDSASGTSGAAALLKVKRSGLRIIGVVSAVIGDVPSGRHFNAITRLTLPKLWDICDMIGPRLDKYACSDYMLRRRPTQAKGRFLYLSV